MSRRRLKSFEVSGEELTHLKWRASSLIFSLLSYASLGSLTLCLACEDTAESERARSAPRGDDGPRSDLEPPRDARADQGESTALAPPPEPPPPFAAPEERRALDGLQWWVTSRAQQDPVGAAFERGEVDFPTAGESHGLRWREVTVEDGSPLATNQNLYGALRLERDEPTSLIIRADAIAQLWVNDAQQPGDLYGSGRARVPARLQAGENEIYVLGIARGAARVTLEESSWPISFNAADLTRPDLRAGHEEPLWLGLPTLNFGPEALLAVRAAVIESEFFAATVTTHPSLPGGAVSPLSFRLEPKGPLPPAGTLVPLRVAVWAAGAAESYFLDLEWEVIEADAPYRQTFRSPVDLSVQYYGVQLPRDFDPSREYALALSLHGASVEAINQARAYSKREDFIVIAATNRRPFGFDWEEWGHFNALNALDDALRRFTVDPTRIYLTGHSMGGHGTWHVGSHNPGRFAALGPSAGWSSFYSYGGAERPGGPFGRARAHSDTPNYLENLAQRGIYLIHGDADDNVPLREGERLFELASMVSDDVEMHVEPGAGHWWDGEVAEGVDCVDWPPLFDFFRARRLDPLELDFSFRSAHPSYNGRHSYLRLLAAEDPGRDLSVTSRYEASGESLRLSLDNVRRLEIDGAALRSKGVTAIEVDGERLMLPDGPLLLGEEGGKGPGRSGPFNQVYRAPFCWIYPDEEEQIRTLAAYLSSTWALIGNGQSCALPFSAVSEPLRRDRNLIYLGFYPEELPLDLSLLPFSWDDLEVEFRGERTFGAAAMSLVPRPSSDPAVALLDDRRPPAEGWSPAHIPGRLDAFVSASYGWEHLISRVGPFSSRGGMPDFLLWSERGLIAAGLYDAEWAPSDALTVP